jgi:sialate O-acetylesterase
VSRFITHSLAARLAVLSLVAATVASSLDAQAASSERRTSLRVPRLFADQMVLQRETSIPIWGWAEPGADVFVDFHGHTTRTKATRAGTWKASLPSEQAGGPFELNVRSGSARVDIHDVLVGDVWLASGQSNMEFTVAQANNAAQEIAGARDSSIRQFKVPTSWADAPESDLAGGAWAPADPQHVGAFTAVGYFFARDLRKSVGVPIGIINTTWGGSNIETWISRSAQHITGDDWSAIRRREAAHMDAIKDSLRTKLGALPTKDEGIVNGKAVWADPSLDDSHWSDMPVPSHWESNGYPGMDGVAWYRTSFDLDDNQRRSGVAVTLAAIDDDDVTWVNGVEVGRTIGYNVARSYRIPASALRVGRNLLAVRVADGGGGGGINGAASIVFGDGTQRSLAGTWKFKVGEISFQPDGQVINKIPSVLYNKMLHPLVPFAITGFLWYQGESNANNMEQASAYRGQFTTLIESWRREWQPSSGRNVLPFLWVQLPNFGSPDTVPPATAAWATQRESMSAALSLPKTGQAIAIDVGDADNIHPRNKQDVGARLARVARKVVYGEAVVASGPTYKSHTVRGDTMIVEFANANSGLISRSSEGRVGGFSIAGADRKFVWANARIVGGSVYVWSDRVRKPVAARYAWANNPADVNLYNGEQLPAAPFRTDRW